MTPEERIKIQWEKLPADVKSALANSKWEEHLVEIGKKNALRVDQIGNFQTETVLVLLGLTHPDEYGKELQKRLNIVAPKAEAIVKDAEELIFKNIRERLKEVYTANRQTGIPAADAVFEKSGIELTPDLPPNMPQTSGEDRKTLLADVENPLLIPNPTVVGKDIVASKLTETFTIPKKVTDQSLGGQTPMTPSAKRPADPYHEPIE